MSTAPSLSYVYAVHLSGDPTRRLPRTHCGKDLVFHKGLVVTADPAEVTCASCNRLVARSS